jgi:lipid II isoglutaminyl synthase (glutamine-hydrolysing)
MRLGSKLLFILALWLGKIVYILSRMAGKQGTTLPGSIALKLCPDLIAHLAGQLAHGTIIVTGTNGKTTTSNMLASILRKAGYRLTFNQAGSNLITGITTVFLNSSNWLGRIQTDLALLEVDEATIVKIAPLIKAHTVLVTNFFRDQLDRYGELDKTVGMVRDSIANHLPEATMILNADDPLVAQMGTRMQKVVYYGVASNKYSSFTSEQAREAKFCSFCGGEYEYQLYHYGQLGIYACPNCDFKRPEPEILATDIDLKGIDGIEFRLGNTKIELKHQGFYNVYNALAAGAVALNLQVNPSVLSEALADFAPQAGRMEQFAYANSQITLSLVKNPTGFNEVIRAMVQTDRALGLLIAINDNAADGRDISWLWDVDFEKLVGQAQWVVCSGSRAEDMAVRLKYAGLQSSIIIVNKDLPGALQEVLGRIQAEQAVYVLPTYTALFPIRDLLSKVRSHVYAS